MKKKKEKKTEAKKKPVEIGGIIEFMFYSRKLAFDFADDSINGGMTDKELINYKNEVLTSLDNYGQDHISKLSPIEQLLATALYAHCIHFEIHPEIQLNEKIKIHPDFLVMNTLMIETDGKQGHLDQKDRIKDYQRDRELVRQGYTAIRFGSTEIFSNIFGVIVEIQNILKAQGH